MKTRIGACDSPFDLNCPCKMFEWTGGIAVPQVCMCSHSIMDHTYEATEK